MPVTVVVGGQFGSEGKGKVALHVARQRDAAAVVRVGGTNSGHTAVGLDGKMYALRQLPAAALAPHALVLLPPGSLIDIQIFEHEVALLGLTPEQVRVDPRATVIDESDKAVEQRAGLVQEIGSTGSGTGAALQRRISRKTRHVLAETHACLKHYCHRVDTTSIMRELLSCGQRIVIEGTQGFGLSLLHGDHYPKATSRDTSAAAFVGETGLSPLDVDEIVLVIRSYPIRVAGDSGPFPGGEISWAEIARQAGLPDDYCEQTTATRKIRRVGKFDAETVRKAIAVNNPTSIVLNHLDYVEPTVRAGRFGARAGAFVRMIEGQIDRQISEVGIGPASLVPRKEIDAATATGLRNNRNLEVAAPA